jgi:hypothetical protein
MNLTFLNKIKNTDPLMGAKFKSKTHLLNSFFIFGLFERLASKFLKMHKKVISKTSLTNKSKSGKSAYFCQVFANNFFWYIFKNFSNRFEISAKILSFLIPILNF